MIVLLIFQFKRTFQRSTIGRIAHEKSVSIEAAEVK
jgi:hypothetical protein